MKDRRKFFKMSGGGVLALASMSFVGFLPFKLFSKSKTSKFASSRKADFKVETHPSAISRGNSARKGSV